MQRYIIRHAVSGEIARTSTRKKAVEIIGLFEGADCIAGDYKPYQYEIIDANG